MTTINISVWNACNLRCNFCYNDSWRDNKTFFRTYDEIVKNMNDLYEKDMSLIFIWWEPTMHPNFLELLLEAKKIWFVKINLATNLIKFSDQNYLNNILWLWIIKWIIASIHSNSDFIEDKITWRKWVFQKKETALKNINIFNWNNISDKVNIYINFVINKDNYLLTSSIAKKMYKIWVNEFRFYTMMLFNHFSIKNLDAVPKYSDFIPIINNLDNDILNICSIHWAPLCISTQVKFWKIRELDINYIKNINSNNIKLFDNHIKNKEKVKECNRCYAYWKFCFWVYKWYLKKYWASEFKGISKEMIIDRIGKFKY